MLFQNWAPCVDDAPSAYIMRDSPLPSRVLIHTLLATTARRVPKLPYGRAATPRNYLA